MKHGIITAFVISAFSMNGWSQHLAITELDLLIEQTRKKYGIPAISITAIHGEGLTHAIKGVRITDSNKSIMTENLFHIGSCSKSILATLAARLVEEGKINWSTRFFDLFEEWESSSNPAYSMITLEDLFLCQAGIQPYTSGTEEFPEIDPMAEQPRLEFARYLLRQPPASQSNSDDRFKFLYSNAGYTLISLMLERVTGLSYEELIRTEMKHGFGIDAYFGFPNKIDPSQPWGHLISGKKVETFSPDHPYRIDPLIVPAGDLSMRSLDFARYIQFHLDGLRGSDNYLKSETYKYLHHKYHGFSLGISNGKISGRKFSGMDGSAGTFFCRAMLFSEEDFAFTLLMNAGSGKPRMKAVDYLTGKLLKKQFGWWWRFWM